MLKRIYNEINNSKEIKNAEFDEETRKLSFIHGKNNNYITFIMPLNYPFYPPKNFRMNYKHVNYHIMGNSTMIYKYFKIDCICCYTILCTANWSPSVTIEKILKEYDLIKNIINCSNVFDFIEKKNYLNDDVLKIITSYIK